MFTGLIEEVGKVVRIEMAGASARLTVAAGFPPGEVAIGDSIAVSGACLTVVEKSIGAFTFDVSPETISRTAFRQLKSGSVVNLERALRLSDRLDGHLVAGHVDCVATIAERRETSGNNCFNRSRSAATTALRILCSCEISRAKSPTLAAKRRHTASLTY